MPLEFGNNTDVTISGKLETSGLEYIKFTTSDVSNVLGRINGNVDGDNGGELQFYTKVDGASSVTEKLRINNIGAIGIGGANYGTQGQVLTSNGPGSAVSWQNGGTTYTAGTGVSISPSNEISIGQEVSTTNTVTFKSLELAKDYNGFPILPPTINFIDSQNGGTLAFINMESDGSSGGRLQFSTRDGSLSNERLRINRYGAIGIGGANYGTQGQVLISNGSDSAVSWGNNYIHDSRAQAIYTLYNSKSGWNMSALNGNSNLDHISTYSTFNVVWRREPGWREWKLYFDRHQSVSDNRVKHNEIIIENGLEVLRQLEPQKYQKTYVLYPADYSGNIIDEWKWESGFIAQDILNIPDLSYLIIDGDFINTSGEFIEAPYRISNYNDIFVYNVAATKELDTLVQNQNTRIQQLEMNIQQQQTLIENLTTRLVALESS